MQVPDESFLELQSELFSSLHRMHADPEAAVDVLCWDGQFEAAASVAKLTRKARENFRGFTEVTTVVVFSLRHLN